MIINFSKKIYNLNAIKRSIKAYEGLAVFVVVNEKNNIQVKINNISNNLNEEIIKNEFCNYVLSEVKNN